MHTEHVNSCLLYMHIALALSLSLYVSLSLSLYIYIYIYIYVCVYVYIYIYICIRPASDEALTRTAQVNHAAALLSEAYKRGRIK